eukprot:6213835-Pleurochrysis_carterae.AAC.4
MKKRLQVLCLWTVLAAFVRRRRGLERNSNEVYDELEGGRPVATVECFDRSCGSPILLIIEQQRPSSGRTLSVCPFDGRIHRFFVATSFPESRHYSAYVEQDEAFFKLGGAEGSGQRVCWEESSRPA